MTTKKCFFISRIGEENSDVRLQSNYIFTLLKGILAELGYIKFERADFISRTGNITQQVIELLLDSDLVIADLSGKNANVFYELGIRHATNKAFVQIKNQNEIIPFDLSQVRTISYNYDETTKSINDIDTKLFTDNIISFVRECELRPFEVKNPISGIDSISPLKNENLPVERILVDIIHTLSSGLQIFVPPNMASVNGMTKDSHAPFVKSIKDVLLDTKKRVHDLREGVITCSGPLINSTFKNFMEFVETEFIAVSVNDLNFWLSKPGELYLDVTLQHKKNKRNIHLERIFVIQEDTFFTEEQIDKIFISQIEKGYSIRFAYDKSLLDVVDNVNRLDFGLFDNYAVSFFRATEGRTYTVSTSKDKCDKYRKYYEDVCFHCIPIIHSEKKIKSDSISYDSSLIESVEDFLLVKEIIHKSATKKRK